MKTIYFFNLKNPLEQNKPKSKLSQQKIYTKMDLLSKGNLRIKIFE